MSGWLTVWRAAQLVGVPRGALQQRIRAGELAVGDDGRIATDSLLALYPQVRLEDSGLFERVVRIRDEAFGKRIRERLLPSQEVLAQRLFAQTQELADVRRHLQRYHALLQELRERIAAQAAQAGAEQPAWQDLQRFAQQGLARVLATESVNPLDVMDEMLKVMSAQVTLQPSGHEFTVQGHANLLQAGLQAGLKLNYGCGNGSCGMCKVRVVSGQVAPVAHGDYPLSEAERAQGYALMCTHTAASSELLLETLEAGGPTDIPPQQIVTSVRAITPLAADTRLLHLQTPRTHRLRFLAGQSATLGFTEGGADAHAALPIASCPCDDRNLHFFIGRDADDAFARAVFEGRLRPGQPVTVWGPQGDFVLADSPRPLVFAACDLGFAPVKSLIEHALALEAAPSLSLFWLATREGGHFQANQCRAWSEALDGFEATLLSHTDPADGARAMEQAMRADLFAIDCDFYLAGPGAFVTALDRLLEAAGVPASQRFAVIL
ncbi:flavodoxin reductase family protein [Burkholderiales bacterium JOSHI_001]|nr:flavodoxin reductase family protein [Burkholderiales bacterium JOSHI_001]